MKTKGDYEQRFYGIAPGTIITVQHILSILLYTNYSKHSYLFSATYRKNDMFETNISLKTRHSEFWWWGKLLREAVEIYGECMRYRTDIGTFYHGISDTLLFNTTKVNLYGPVSTTGGLLLSPYFLCILLLFTLSCVCSFLRLHHSMEYFRGNRRCPRYKK